MLKKKMTIEDLAGMMKREFDITGARLDKIDERFLNVATRDDLINLAAIMATKDDLRLVNERLDRLEESVRNLTNAVDKFIKIMTEYRQEQLAMGERLNRHEEWIKVIAGKVGVELES